VFYKAEAILGLNTALTTDNLQRPTAKKSPTGKYSSLHSTPDFSWQLRYYYFYDTFTLQNVTQAALT